MLLRLEMLLERLSIDIVEVVIVKSNSYVIFQDLQKLLPKLSEPKRVSRINDKMTKVRMDGDTIEYELLTVNHREYNKPSCLTYKNRCDYNLIYLYKKDGILKRENGFTRINVYFRDMGSSYYNSKDSQELLINMKSSYYKGRIERIIERGLLYL